MDNQIRVKYHFCIHLNFKKDIDVAKLEKHFGLSAYKLTFKKDAKDREKTAKIWYRTEDFTNIMVDECFENFVLKIKDNFVDLPQFLQEYDGKCVFQIVFKELHEYPIISLSKDVIEILNQLNASFETDFLCN